MTKKNKKLLNILNNKLKIGAHIFTCETRPKPYKRSKRALEQGELTGRHPTMYGYMSPDDLLIVINEQVAPSFQLETLLHEILHALIEIDGTRESFKRGTEERIVQALGHGLTQVLLDNKNVLDAIICVRQSRPTPAHKK